MFCICGKEINITSTTPWIQYTMGRYGNIISGTCIHGILFSFIRGKEEWHDCWESLMNEA